MARFTLPRDLYHGKGALENLKVTPIGGMNANNAEAENCRIHTRFGKVYEGTLQLDNASVHVNKDYSDTKREFSSMEVVLDEFVKSAEDTEKKLIALQLVKIAHVNSHSIDDLMQDLSPWSKEQIRDAFEFVMIILGGGEHFDSHWNETGN